MWYSLDRRHVSVGYGACALHAGYQKKEFTLIIFDIYYFYTATMVTRTHHNITLYVRCLSC